MTLKSYRLDEDVIKSLKILKIEIDAKNINEVLEYLLSKNKEASTNG